MLTLMMQMSYNFNMQNICIMLILQWSYIIHYFLFPLLLPTCFECTPIVFLMSSFHFIQSISGSVTTVPIIKENCPICLLIYSQKNSLSLCLLSHSCDSIFLSSKVPERLLILLFVFYFVHITLTRTSSLENVPPESKLYPRFFLNLVDSQDRFLSCLSCYFDRLICLSTFSTDICCLLSKYLISSHISLF